jgi:hypothetical protein
MRVVDIIMTTMDSSSDSDDERGQLEPGKWKDMELSLTNAPVADMLCQASDQLLMDHWNNPLGDSRTIIYFEDDFIYRAGRWEVENLYPCDVSAFVATFLGKVRLENPGMVQGLASNVWIIVIV